MDMKEPGWNAIILDISQGGVRIQLQRRFERGTGLALELPALGDEDSEVIFVKVVHLRRNEDGNYTLGCQFLSALSEDEVHRQVARSKNSAVVEKIEVAELAEDDDVILAELAEEEEIIIAELVAEAPPLRKKPRPKRSG